MKISLNWLKDYIAFDISSSELIHKLTMAGLEVEKQYSVEGDEVIEIEVTPNRADCLSMIGISREVAAILNKKRQEPVLKKTIYPKTKCDVSIKEKEACRQYIGTVLENVCVAPTDDGIVKRLRSLGMRSINNIVDITNFCLMETGQPLHVFDYDKLIGGKIIVRLAKKGEKIVTLDDMERELDPSVLVIADEQRPVAIAGIMGGKNTEVTDATKNILLESAYFDPVLIRRTSRKLGVSSDSAYRFERGVDVFGVEKGAQRALNFILEYANGKITRHTNLSVSRKKQTGKPVRVTLEKINTYIGASLSEAKCKNILKTLDFHVDVTKKGVFDIKAPSFRSDIKYDVDIIEEISRMIGYDNLPSSLPQIKPTAIPTSAIRLQRANIRASLCAQGFNEIITFSMINQKSLDKARQGDLRGIKINNPLTLDQEYMRPSLLPSFLIVAVSNINRGQKDLSLFETGKIYNAKGEHEVLGMLMTGDRLNDWRLLKKREVDFYDIKGALEAGLSGVAVDEIGFRPVREDFLDTGTCAEIVCRSKRIGVIGKIDRDVLTQWNIKQENIFFVQIELEKVYNSKETKRRFEPITEYPCIVRGVSLAVKQDITFRQVKDTAFELGAGLLADVVFDEEYLGDKIPDGYRGVIFSLIYQSSERTLTEQEVNDIDESINRSFVQTLNAIKR